IVTHYPIHIDSNHPKKFINIHGHIHEKVIDFDRGPWFNISVERINYTPIHIDEIIKQKGKFLGK
ncbi:hypothetical protein ACI3PL_20975, partial [Lacticaseibacillus paracasei]